MRSTRKLIGLCFVLFFSNHLFSQGLLDTSDGGNWSTHFQLTVINQSHSGFRSPYKGMNSLADSIETGATSVTATLFLGRRLWKGAIVYFDPEMSGGKGLSGALGLGGALNGETYRIGDPQPVVTLARTYIQQVIPLGGDTSYEDLADVANQVADRVPTHRMVISLGKFSTADFFDKNRYSHDPRSQFMNWSLMSNGAWDYPANTRGYTFGGVIEWINPGWALRFSSVAVPKVANHSNMEYVLGKAHSETVEFEKKMRINKRPGLIRLLYSYTASRAPSYTQGLQAVKTGDSALLAVIDGNGEATGFGGNKSGLFLNLEQSITDDLGLFARAGWNDGKYVSWAFTEIDQTIHLGLSLKGTKWKRADDVVGIAGVVNGISADHRNFLKAGGYGFIIGDGALNYGHEAILEAYYNVRLLPNFWTTFDYQFASNPGYNKDRGPVHVFAVRGHVEF